MDTLNRWRRGGGAGVALLNEVGLLQYLPGIAQKFLACGGEHHTPVRAAENGDVQLLLQLPYGGGQAGLGEKERLRRAADRARVRHGGDIFQLLKRHE